MKDTPENPNPEMLTFPRLPGWVSASRSIGDEDPAFVAGAALATLHLTLNRPEVPMELLRERLALGAAAASLTLTGRPETEAQLRDELHLLRPGDQPGPAGAVYDLWQRAVTRPATPQRLTALMPDRLRPAVPMWLAAGQGGPVDRAAGVLQAVLADHPRAEPQALLLADAVLSRACGWDRIVPLLALGLKRRDLRQPDDLPAACHRALPQVAALTIGTALDLSRRVSGLRAAAPKLRAKGAAEAVHLFLTRDALAPSALTHLMSDRAARRLCDRLVDLGVVRELTGRSSFRLYGV